MPHAGTVQPAKLARAVRRAALAAGVEIHERTTARLLGDRPRCDLPSAIPIEVTSGDSWGVFHADQVVVATNAWAAAWRPVARRLLSWSSYIVLTEPIPRRLGYHLGPE